MSGEWISYGISGLFILLAAIYSGRNALRNRREDRRAASTNSIPPTWPEVWARMNDLEEKNTALINVIEDLIKQWPKSEPRPRFDRADVNVLSGTIPSEWLRPTVAPPERKN